MRILITGASGLLGINLALEAARDGRHAVFGAVNSRRLKSVDFTVIATDLLVPGALERLLDETQPEWVIHCGALALVDACEADPLLAQKMNAGLPEKLAANVARGGARLLHVSTDAVFDGLRGGYSEEDEPNPLSVYARTKLEGERAVMAANSQAIVARTNLFGWSLSGERSLAEWFLNNLWAGRAMQGFTDVYFCPLLVNHLAQIFLMMLEKGLHGLYHVVSSECTSKYEFGLALARQFGLDPALIIPSSVSDGNLQAVRSPRLTLKVGKLTKALGVAPPGLQPGLERYFDLYQSGYPESLRKMQ